MREINIKYDMPDVQTALNRLYNAIINARASGVREVKIVHGYGSSGKGGAIKSAVHNELRTYRIRRTIKDFCPGEQFGPFSETGRRLVQNNPQIKADRDWGRNNEGVTVVVFK